MMPSDRRQQKRLEPEFLADPRIDGLRDTYMGLRSFDQGDGVWVSIDTLMKKLGISESTVHRHIRKLQKHGVLEVKTQHQSGQQKTNFYSFPTPDWWFEPDPEGGVTVTPY